MPNTDAFSDHVKTCRQCRLQPQALCTEGAGLLCESDGPAAAPVAPISPAALEVLRRMSAVERGDQPDAARPLPSPRQLRRHRQRLREAGCVVPVGQTPRGTSVYQIPDTIPRRDA